MVSSNHQHMVHLLSVWSISFLVLLRRYSLHYRALVHTSKRRGIDLYTYIFKRQVQPGIQIIIFPARKLLTSTISVNLSYWYRRVTKM